jgi:predicted nucleic acid-binding protein
LQTVVHDLILVTGDVRNFQHFDGLRMERWHRTAA